MGLINTTSCIISVCWYILIRDELPLSSLTYSHPLFIWVRSFVTCSYIMTILPVLPSLQSSRHPHPGALYSELWLGGPRKDSELWLGGPRKDSELWLGGPKKDSELWLGGPWKDSELWLGGPRKDSELWLGGPRKDLRCGWVDLGNILSCGWVDLGKILSCGWVDLGKILSCGWVDLGKILRGPTETKATCSVQSANYQGQPTGLDATVASFTKEVNPRLAKRPLVFNGRLANRGLPSLVNEATV